MNAKKRILSTVQEEFDLWESLLTGLSEEQLVTGQSQFADHWSIKDVVAHLMAWQRRSVARLEAALLNREPEFPSWSETLDRNSEEELDQINAWIYETNHDRSWDSVYQDWRDGFIKFLELGEALPESDLLEVGRYKWLEEYPLSIILLSSCEHHEEHRAELRAWLQQHGEMASTG